MPYINKSLSNNWGTPSKLYEKLNSKYNFDFDPCPHPKPSWDGLEVDWKQRNFVNPPYSDIESWAKKCRAEQLKGNMSVLLIPARTDTKYFHDWILPYAKVEFIKGRIKFKKLDDNVKTETTAPFPSILCVYNV